MKTLLFLALIVGLTSPAWSCDRVEKVLRIYHADTPVDRLPTYFDVKCADGSYKQMLIYRTNEENTELLNQLQPGRFSEPTSDNERYIPYVNNQRYDDYIRQRPDVDSELDNWAGTMERIYDAVMRRDFGTSESLTSLSILERAKENIFDSNEIGTFGPIYFPESGEWQVFNRSQREAVQVANQEAAAAVTDVVRTGLPQCLPGSENPESLHIDIDVLNMDGANEKINSFLTYLDDHVVEIERRILSSFRNRSQELTGLIQDTNREIRSINNRLDRLNRNIRRNEDDIRDLNRQKDELAQSRQRMITEQRSIDDKLSQPHTLGTSSRLDPVSEEGVLGKLKSLREAVTTAQENTNLPFESSFLFENRSDNSNENQARLERVKNAALLTDVIKLANPINANGDLERRMLKERFALDRNWGRNAGTYRNPGSDALMEDTQKRILEYRTDYGQEVLTETSLLQDYNNLQLVGDQFSESDHCFRLSGRTQPIAETSGRGRAASER